MKKIEVVDWIDENKLEDGIAYVFTHAGVCHGDDITASIIYAGACECEKIVIVRISRDDNEKMEIAKSLEKSRKNVIIVDIGGGEYDHHGLKKARPIEGATAEKTPPNYASAGLVWKDYGKKYIENLINQLVDNDADRKTILNDENLNFLHRKTDEDIIQPIDAEDNGKPIDKREITEFYKDFYPNFYDKKPNYNGAFLNTLRVVQVILDYEISQIINSFLSRDVIKCTPLDYLENTEEKFKQEMQPYITSVIQTIHSFGGNCDNEEFVRIAVNVYKEYEKYGKYVVISVANAKINCMKNKFIATTILKSRIQNKKYFRNGILEIPSQTIPWTDFAIDFNEEAELLHIPVSEQINFVLWVYSTGGYALQCVPPSRENSKGNRFTLYNDGSINLTQMHQNRFFARAENEEALRDLAAMSVIKSIEDANKKPNTKKTPTPPRSGGR